MTAATTFERAVALVLRYENGYVDDPQDPGGETNFGISKRAYPALDIAALTEAEATAIYHRDYWVPIMGDALPDAFAIMTFDAAVNMGVTRASRQLQAVLGCGEDGIIGAETCAAASHVDPLGDAAADLCARRCLDYAGSAHFATYGWGWLRRATHTFYEALQ